VTQRDKRLKREEKARKSGKARMKKEKQKVLMEKGMYKMKRQRQKKGAEE